MSNYLPASSQLDLFGEIDSNQLLPGPFSSSSSLSSGGAAGAAVSNWRYYSIDFFLNNLYPMPSLTNLSNNSSLHHHQDQSSTSLSSSDDEASDHLLYLIIPLYSLVFVIGTIGNVLVILTVATVKQMRNTTNALILHLAIANLSFVLMCIPHTIYGYVVRSYNFPRLLCKLANTLMYLSAYVCIYILVLMSIDRFLGVVYAVKSTKYRTERNAHLAVIVVWLVGIILASPNMFFYDVLLVPSSVNDWYCTFRTDEPLINTARRITAYCFALFGLIVPLIVIAILYGLIIHILRKNSKGKQVAKGKKRVTRMVSAVISSFVICWTPMQIYLISTHHNQVLISFAIISQSLVYISACINPILYAFLSEPFRKAFQEFLTCSKLISNFFLAHHNSIENHTPRKSSAYRVIHQHSITQKTSLSPFDDELNTKRYSRGSDLTSEAITITRSSEPIKYNRLSNTNTSASNL